MTIPYQKLRDQMSPEAQAKSTTMAQKMIQEIELLKELRKVGKYNQTRLVEDVNTTQADVSKIEK